MKPAFIITGLGLGGAESVLYRLLECGSLAQDAVVISLGSGDVFAPRLRELGVTVYELGMSRGRPDLFAPFKIAQILRDNQVDVVSTWMYHADLLGGLGARLARVPVIWGIRNSTLSREHTSLATRSIAALNAVVSRWLPTWIVSCSVRAREIHERLGYASAKFRVIPNGVDVHKFRPDGVARDEVREELGLDRSVPLVGMIARFDPQKNHHGFLDAFARVAARIPTAHAVLVGGGTTDDNAELGRWIEESGLGGHVHLLGLRQDIARIAAALDVSVLSSTYGEAFPSVLAESMSCGVPCVATDVGDASLILGETGAIVAVGDMVQLADEVCRVLLASDTQKLCLAEAARLRIVENFGLPVMVERYESLLSETASG
jgi:glycosyltransferase involved in cell wall biosynthesis